MADREWPGRRSQFAIVLGMDGPKDSFPLLDSLHSPQDIRGFSDEELERLADEMRRAIIEAVSTTGGHLGSSLGAIELTQKIWRSEFLQSGGASNYRTQESENQKSRYVSDK